METTIIERIRYIIEQEGESPRSFSNLIKFNYSTLNNYLTGRRNTIDSELIRRIILSFDNISAEWLLLGKGKMLNSERKKDIENNVVNNTFDESQYVSMKKYERIVNLFGQTASELKEMALENKRLYEEIRNLKGQLKLAKYA